MTVYKAIKKEADAAAKIAIALIKGETPDVSDTINNGTKDIPVQFETPVAVTKDNIKEYIGEPDFPKQEDICAGQARGEVQGDRTLRDDRGPVRTGRVARPLFRRR